MAKEKMLLQRWKAVLSACLLSVSVGTLAYLLCYNWSSRLERISRLPPNRLFRESKALQRLMNFNSRIGSSESYQNAQRHNPRDTDVFLVTYPKSGTTWLSQIAHGLRSNGSMAFDEISDVVPWDVAALDCGQDLNADQGFTPRLFKSHQSSDIIAKGARYVVLVRKPEDVLVSLHRYFCKGDWPRFAGFAHEDLPLNVFAAGVFASHFNEGYWHHLASWYTCCWQDPRVHWVTYEDIMDNTSKEIQRLADFMGLDSSDRPRLAIAEAQASREFMLKHREQFDDHDVLQHTLPPYALEVLSSAPTRPKVQPASSPVALSKDLKALLDTRWVQLITPVAGWKSFREMREAIHHRTVHKGNTSSMVNAATPQPSTARSPLYLLHRTALTNAATVAGVTFGVCMLLLAVLLRSPRLVHCLPACLRMCLLPAKEDERPDDNMREGGEVDSELHKSEPPRVSTKGLLTAAVATAVGLICLLKVGWHKESAKNVCAALHREPCQDLYASLAAAKRAGVVVSAYAEDLAWLSELPPGPVWVYAHERTSRPSAHPNARLAERLPADEFNRKRAALEASGNVHFNDIPNVGDEALAFLWHIVRHYDELPEVIVFLHGHRRAAQHSDFDMAELLGCLCADSNAWGGLYQSLNSRVSRQLACFPTEKVRRRGRPDKFDLPRRGISKLWDPYFAAEFGSVKPERFCMDCCAQFLTSRAAIRAHPLDFYEGLLRGVNSSQVNGYDMEMFWRTILLKHT